MVFTTNACVNTEMRMCGRPSLSYSTTCHWQQLSRDRSSVSTVGSPHQSTLSIKSDNSTEYKRFPMKAPFAIFCGRIPMIVADGASPPEALVTHSDKIFQSNSIMPTDSNWYHVHINWLWTATTGLMNAMWSQYSLHPTIATDVETKQPLWRSTNSWSILSFNSTPHHVR